jgi:hypothetical protein
MRGKISAQGRVVTTPVTRKRESMQPSGVGQLSGDTVGLSLTPSGRTQQPPQVARHI